MFPTRLSRWIPLGIVVLSAFALTTTACLKPAADADTSAFDVEALAGKPNLSVDWRQHLNPTPPWDYRPQELAPPAYSKETNELFVATTNGELFRIRGGDGKVKWNADLQGGVHGQPTLAPKSVYVGTLEGQFSRVRRRNGKVEWTRQFDGSVGSPAAVGEGRVFVTTSKNRIYALDAKTGKELWTYERAGRESFTLQGTGSPTVYKDSVIVGFSDGTLVSLQIDTGEPMWAADLSGDKREFLDIDEKPIIRNSTVYASSYEGGLYALDADNGDMKWFADLSSIAAFAYGNEMLYVASAIGRVVAVDANDGKLLYALKMKNRAPVDLMATERYIIVATGDGPLYFLDRMTCYPLRKWAPGSGFSTRTVLGRDHLYAFSNQGYLYGLDISF